MAKSQLLKDLALGNGNIESILMRLKVILKDFNNSEISDWVEGELAGYREGMKLPTYRVFEGVVRGHCIIKGRMEHKNYNVPISALMKQNKLEYPTYEDVTKVEITDGIAVLESMCKDKESHFAKPIPSEWCYKLSSAGFQIISMQTLVSINQVEAIKSITKSKLIDIILELEKEFKDIDSLDIEDQIESRGTEERNLVMFNLLQLIDNSINIGDNNKFTKSEIGHSEVEKL